VPPEACEHLTRAVGGKETEDLSLNTGHIGICVRSKCQAACAPNIAGWLKEREGARMENPRTPSVKESTPKKKAAPRKTVAGGA
jgi:polyhydroxyalkanoate synthase